jgi:hypothetical protein
MRGNDKVSVMRESDEGTGICREGTEVRAEGSYMRNKCYGEKDEERGRKAYVLGDRMREEG